MAIFSQNLHREVLSNLLRVSDVFLEMSGDSNYNVGFLVDDISEPGYTIKSLCSPHKKVLAQSRHGQKYSPSSHRKPHANLMRLCSINCLEMPSDSRNYFVCEFSKLVFTIKSLGSRH